MFRRGKQESVVLSVNVFFSETVFCEEPAWYVDHLKIICYFKDQCQIIIFILTDRCHSVDFDER
jgi:hypothetical protein